MLPSHTIAGLRIKPLHDAAKLGTIVHGMLAELASGNEPDVAATCAREGWADTEAVASMYAYGIRAYNELKPYLPNPQVEVSVSTGPPMTALPTGEQYVIEGTVDLLSPLTDKSAVFVDYKTGFVDDGYANQMYGYAACIWCELGCPSDFEITGVVVFLRHEYYRVVKYTTQQIAGWLRMIQHNVIPNRLTFRPGKQCRHCHYFHSCEARKEVVASSIDTLVRGGIPLTPETKPFHGMLTRAKAKLAGITEATKNDPDVQGALNDMIYIAKLVEQQVDEMRSTIRSLVEKVGPIPLTESTELALREQKRRGIPDPEAAMPVLRRLMSDGDICKGIKMSVPELISAYQKGFVKGEKVAAAKQLEKELSDAGVLQVTSFTRLEEIDVSKAGDDVARNSNRRGRRTGGGKSVTPEQRPEREGGSGGGDDPDNGQTTWQVPAESGRTQVGVDPALDPPGGGDADGNGAADSGAAKAARDTCPKCGSTNTRRYTFTEPEGYDREGDTEVIIRCHAAGCDWYFNSGDTHDAGTESANGQADGQHTEGGGASTA